MPVFFETAADVSAPETYKKKLKAALLKVGNTRDRFIYFEQFKFDNGTRPVLVPGKLDPAVAKDLAKKGQKPARGFCTFAQDTGLSLVVTKGQVDEEKVQKSLKLAGLTCNVTISAGTDTDDELDELAEGGAVSGKVREFGGMLEQHLAGRTAEDREAHARLALEMGERATNAGKGEGQPHAHSLSAHGPGTDQTPRIVAGYRADQVADGRKVGTLPADVALNAPDGRAANVPGFTQVGDAPSNISSAFGSATAMLGAVEEAFSQVTQLESFIAKELKHAKNDMRVLGDDAVKDALKDLVATRKLLDAAKAKVEATKAARNGGNVSVDLAEVRRLTGELDRTAQAFKDAKDTAMAALAQHPQTTMAGERFVRTVEPGMKTGTSYATSEPALETGAAIDAATMQKRFEGMTTTEDLTKATVVLDPAYVTNSDGTTHRAGWQAQTAFPTTEGGASRGLSQPEYVVMRMKERLAKAEEVMKRADAKRVELKAKEAEDLDIRKAAEIVCGNAETPIIETPRGQPTDPTAQAAFDDATNKVTEAKAALAATRTALVQAGAIHAAAKKARDEADVSVKAVQAQLDKAATA